MVPYPMSGESLLLPSTPAHVHDTRQYSCVLALLPKYLVSAEVLVLLLLPFIYGASVIVNLWLYDSGRAL